MKNSASDFLPTTSTVSLVWSASAPGTEMILYVVSIISRLLNDHSYRNKFGVKAVLGRTNVGSFAFASGYPKKTNIYTKYYLYLDVFQAKDWNIGNR